MTGEMCKLGKNKYFHWGLEISIAYGVKLIYENFDQNSNISPFFFEKSPKFSKTEPSGP